jgi:hypothetical protein
LPARCSFIVTVHTWEWRLSYLCAELVLRAAAAGSVPFPEEAWKAVGFSVRGSGAVSEPPAFSVQRFPGEPR